MIAIALLACSLAWPDDAAATLSSFARLPGGTLRDGPPCGASLEHDTRAGGRAPFSRQLVSGISGLVALGDGEYLALSDNGFGARDNSADYRLAVHRLRVDFERGDVIVLESIELRDPHRRAGFPIVFETDPARPLSGADFDPESIQRDADGSWWIGDEFGPFLLHFSSTGELLEAPYELPARDGAAFRSPDHPALRSDSSSIASIGPSAGFEALARSPDGLTLLAILEKPLSGAAVRECRAFEFDLETKRFTGKSIGLALPDGARSITDAQFFGDSTLLVLERDDSQGRLDGWKRVAAHHVGENGKSERRELVDLLAIADPDAIAPQEPGDVGCGDGRFALPFLTVESLWIRDENTLIVGVDDNFPLTRGRHLGSGAPDDTEIVKLALAAPLSPPRVRIATFNASLNRDAPGKLLRDLERGDDPQIEKIARILQEVRPDVVLLNEFDVESDELAARAIAAFREHYLARSIEGSSPIAYPYAFAPRTNTGVASGVDLNGDGTIGRSGREYGDDALGFGVFPGQYGFIVLSRFPLDAANARTFGHLLWRELPGAILPDDPATPKKGDFFPDAALAVLPFSSKNHVDLPVSIGDRTLHLLLSHPTPPAFDGPEDKNGLRNAAEIRFWLDYLTPGQDDWIVDANGRAGGLPESESFVLLGDLNSDPFDGDSRHETIRMLLSHRRLVDPMPRSRGAIESAASEAGKAPTPKGDVSTRTADFGTPKTGDLRVDYVLPSRDLSVFTRGVFWPAPDDPRARLVDASDHRLVFVDLVVRDR